MNYVLGEVNENKHKEERKFCSIVVGEYIVDIISILGKLLGNWCRK